MICKRRKIRKLKKFIRQIWRQEQKLARYSKLDGWQIRLIVKKIPCRAAGTMRHNCQNRTASIVMDQCVIKSYPLYYLKETTLHELGHIFTGIERDWRDYPDQVSDRYFTYSPQWEAEAQKYACETANNLGLKKVVKEAMRTIQGWRNFACYVKASEILKEQGVNP